MSSDTSQIDLQDNVRSLRVLLGYSHFPSRLNIRQRVEEWLARLRCAGFNVQPFVLTLDPPNDRLRWAELDLRWRRRERMLLSMYERLSRTLEDFDVFINWNGINVHPAVIPSFPTFNTYACFDDPESSDDLSRPVASAYDCCLVGNAACLEMYRSWGARHVGWWPLGFHSEDHDPTLTVDRILNGDRDVDVTLLCERVSQWRADRLDQFVSAFPTGRYFGRGWPSGFLPECDRVSLLQRTKVGLNIHNSLGPVNYRTFNLPANGVLQLCDNTSHLGNVFCVDKEVVGYDTIGEAIDKCRYYLDHDAERREIAARGFERAVKDYNEIAVFSRAMNHIHSAMQRSDISKPSVPVPEPSAAGTLIYAFERRIRGLASRFDF